MTTEQEDPRTIMGDFVHKYRTLIRPALDKGNLSGATEVFDDCAMKSYILDLNPPVNTDAYKAYKLAVKCLSMVISLSDSTESEFEKLSFGLASEFLRKGIERLERIMSEDSVYENHRLRSLDPEQRENQ